MIERKAMVERVGDVCRAGEVRLGFAGANVIAIVHVETAANEEARLHASIDGLIKPQQVELQIGGAAGARGPAEALGVDRGPVRAGVAVEGPHIVESEDRVAQVREDLLLLGYPEAARERGQMRGVAVAAEEGHVAIEAEGEAGCGARSDRRREHDESPVRPRLGGLICREWLVLMPDSVPDVADVERGVERTVRHGRRVRRLDGRVSGLLLWFLRVNEGDADDGAAAPDRHQKRESAHPRSETTNCT